MCLAKFIYERLYDKGRYKVKGASKQDKHVTQGWAILLCGLKYAKKQYIYYIIKYAHTGHIPKPHLAHRMNHVCQYKC